MKVLILSFILFFASLNIHAQQAQRGLLQKFSKAELKEHLISQEQWKPFPKTPEEWRAKISQEDMDKYISLGDSALKKEFKSLPATAMLEYVRIKDRGNYEDQSFSKRRQLEDLVLAESMEGKGRFADKIADGVWSICEETFWGVPAHLANQKAGHGLADVEDPIVDLFAAETAAVLAWTDYFAGDDLDKVSKMLRPRIKYEVNRRILDPIIIAKYNWLKRPDPNNWVPWIMSNCITASLILEEDAQQRNDLIYFAMGNVDKYINSLGDDGAIDEGPNYWSHAGGRVLDVLDILYSATEGKINIYKQPKIANIASYIYKTHIGGKYFINVSDAEPTLTPDGLALYRFGKSIGDTKMMGFGSWAYHHFKQDENRTKVSLNSRKLFNLFAKDDCAAYPDKLPVIGDVWFPSVQLMSARAKGLFIASHGGHNAESHNHNDVGDFIVYAENHPVIIDLGRGTYTSKTFSSSRYDIWFNTSAFHNLPLINGAQQMAGIEAKATDVTYQNTNQISGLSMDIASAYPDSTVKSWKRSVQLNKNGVVQITDNYVLPKASNNIKQMFMTICPTKTDKAGIITFELPNQKSVVLKYDAAQWDIKKEKLILDKQEDTRIKSSWGDDIWRLVLESKNIPSQGKSNYLIKLD